MHTYRGLDGRHAVLRIVLLWALLLPGLAAAHADAVDFELPAQPLERALERFSIVTGWSVMYPGRLADGRSSHPVHGRMPPQQALQELLQDSGLYAQQAGEHRVVLREAAGAASVPAGPAVPGLPAAEQQRRFAGLQRSLRAAFCGDPAIAPGNYAATVVFQVAADGTVEQPGLLAGSGDSQRDHAVLDALHGLRLPASAADLPQPVTLEIRPAPPGHDCGRQW